MDAVHHSVKPKMAQKPVKILLQDLQKQPEELTDSQAAVKIFIMLPRISHSWKSLHLQPLLSKIRSTGGNFTLFMFQYLPLFRLLSRVSISH